MSINDVDLREYVIGMRKGDSKALLELGRIFKWDYPETRFELIKQVVVDVILTEYMELVLYDTNSVWNDHPELLMKKLAESLAYSDSVETIGQKTELALEEHALYGCLCWVWKLGEEKTEESDLIHRVAGECEKISVK